MIPSSPINEARLNRRLDRVNIALAAAVFVSFGFSLSPAAPVQTLSHLVRPRASLASAVNASDALVNGAVELRLASRDDATHETMTIALTDHADWILFDATDYSFALDEDRITEFLRNDPLFSAATARVHDAQQGWVLQGDVEGEAKSGWDIDHRKVARSIARALVSGKENVTVEATYREATLTYESGSGTKSLTLLGTGRSNFEGSALGRAANVRKALAEHLHGVIVPAGEEFSFNATIADTGGWHDSYVIVNGKDLALEKGGGICQAATTMFRAALLAGLPVVDRANHSLYVTYYKDYGMGIDATIYPGKQDFTFVNDTPDDIVIVARSEGDDAVIELYGVDDGRSVAMEGPYFTQTAPADFRIDDRELKTNEVAWEHEVRYADGRIENETIVSRYLALPRKLHEEYVTDRGIDELILPPSHWVAAGTGETMVMR